MVLSHQGERVERSDPEGLRPRWGSRPYPGFPLPVAFNPTAVFVTIENALFISILYATLRYLNSQSSGSTNVRTSFEMENS
jgi:hypothetical protein